MSSSDAAPNYEGFGLTLIEAVSSGLPLIGFEPYGKLTFIQDGQNGYLIPSSDDHVEMEIKRAFAWKRSASLSGKPFASYEQHLMTYERILMTK